MYNQKSINNVKKILSKNLTNYWTGSECKLFEKEFSKYHGNKYSISVSNGSVALEIALKALALKKNDQIIVTPRSFIISASCVLNLGLKPVFADVDKNGNLNIEGIKKSYNSKIKAVILVHLNGLACDLDPIIKFTKKKKILLIEDCAQAHGAIYKNKKVGTFGDIATWSFCQDKIISTGGEGGMISTNNKKLWLKCWSLKDHGKNYFISQKSKKKGFTWLHGDLGSNYRMTEIQASLGRDQLKTLDNQILKRNKIARDYLKVFKEYEKYNIFRKLDFKCSNCPSRNTIEDCNKCRHSFYRLNLFINKKKINQIDIVKKLNKNNIECGFGSCPEIYREKVFNKYRFFPKQRLPNAKKLGETSLVLKINPFKKSNKLKNEIAKIKKILNSYI